MRLQTRPPLLTYLPWWRATSALPFVCDLYISLYATLTPHSEHRVSNHAEVNFGS